MSAIDEDYLRLRKQVEGAMQNVHGVAPESKEYKDFKKQYLPKNFTFYEKCCNFSESLKIKPNQLEYQKLREAIDTCHLNATPEGVTGFALVVPLTFIFAGLLLGVALPMALSTNGEPSLFFFALFAIVAAVSYLPLRNMPYTLAQNWRAQASNQMVLALFYITTYMRHTSNLERAIDFAAEHVGPPLSLDLKKVVWNVQTEKYASLQESLDAYLLQWRESNLEFVEAMNLVQASLYETSNERRLNSLQKAMDLMLEETYEKMLHYAQNLKSPMTMLHMLGIILPILGLVILPLAVSFLDGVVQWYHLAVLYNFLLPLGVFLLGKSILSRRPSSYGNSDMTDINPNLKQFKDRIVQTGGKTISLSAGTEALVLFAVLFVIGLLPLILHVAVSDPTWDITLLGPHQLLGYVLNVKTGEFVGPFGLGSALLSLSFTVAAGISLGHYYSIRSKRLIKVRDDTKLLEQEFAGAIFQLGNRLGDGIPAEIAFAKVAEVMQGTKSGDFFQAVAINVQKAGMSVEQAIFDPHRGAILLYPSPIIESSMKVLIESSRKGPAEASQSLITMSTYIKEMHRVEERLKDLMADTISGMKSQITFLTPAIAGIVVGITSMITTILGQLQTQMAAIGTGGAGIDTSIPDLGLGLGIPTYYFQIVVGLYVVQIIWLLAYLVNGIENGTDKLNEEYEQAKGLQRGVTLYVLISLVVMVLFNVIAGTVLSGALS